MTDNVVDHGKISDTCTYGLSLLVGGSWLLPVPIGQLLLPVPIGQLLLPVPIGQLLLPTQYCPCCRHILCPLARLLS